LGTTTSEKKLAKKEKVGRLGLSWVVRTEIVAGLGEERDRMGPSVWGRGGLLRRVSIEVT